MSLPLTHAGGPGVAVAEDCCWEYACIAGVAATSQLFCSEKGGAPCGGGGNLCNYLKIGHNNCDLGYRSEDTTCVAQGSGASCYQYSWDNCLGPP